MSKTAVISVKLRSDMTKGEKKGLVGNGYVLGNINVKGTDSVPIAIKKDELRTALNNLGRNAVFKLVSDDEKTYNAMVKNIQLSPMLYQYHHVDFQQVDLDHEIVSNVAVSFSGVDILESRHFLVNRHLDHINVSGFPKDIPDHLTVDVSSLKSGDAVKAGDVKFPKGIKLDIDPETIIITIGEARVKEVAPETTEE